MYEYVDPPRMLDLLSNQSVKSAFKIRILEEREVYHTHILAQHYPILLILSRIVFVHELFIYLFL